MISDSDILLPQLRAVEVIQMHSSQPKMFDFESKVISDEKACDAKTLAARRKRAEIRRFRLKAAANESTAEPLPKRPKGISPNGFKSPEEQELGMFMIGEMAKCRNDRPVDVTGSISSKEERGMDGAGPGQEQTTCQDGDAGATLESRLSALSTGPVSLGHCVVSICGRSREMEDAAVAAPSFLSLPSLRAGLEGSGSTDTYDMFGVFDGHGGAQAAEICKERMSAYLAAEMSTAQDSTPSGWESCMQSCFLRLDGELCGTCPHGSECPATMGTTNSCREPLVLGSVGTTAVVAVVGADDIIVGNCGDSRAVLCRNGQAVPLSFDHKASRPDEVARIEAAGGSVFNWEGHRVCGVLAMSRALGDSYLKPFVTGLPDVTVTARSEEDECLILASDGLWDKLSNEDVCSVARKVLARQRSPRGNFQHLHPHDAKQHDASQQQRKCGTGEAEEPPAHVLAAVLTKLALGRQSKDNISVVVVDLRRS